MKYKVHSTNYTFKPLNFNNNNNFFDDFNSNVPFGDFDNFGRNNCGCKNPCFRPEPPFNCKPNFKPPIGNYPFPCPPPNFGDCSRDNFKYFLIGYLFGSGK